jgi:hypothetical protein
MNDYLSNLSARSFGRTEGIPLVSPRVPSLFEPSHAKRDVFAEVESLVSTDDESAEGHRSPFDASRTSDTRPYRGLQLHRNPAEAVPGIADREISANEPAAAVPAREEPIGAPTGRISIQSPGDNAVKGTTSNGEERQHAIEQPGNGIEPVRGKSCEEEGPARLSEKTPEERRWDKKTILTEQGKGIAGPDRSSAAVESAKQKVISPRIAHTFLRPIEPTHREWTNSSHRDATARPEPTIQVTIGRIEVRAVTQAVQNRPKPKGQTLMSLDEYLRGRSGGRR